MEEEYTDKMICETGDLFDDESISESIRIRDETISNIKNRCQEIINNAGDIEPIVIGVCNFQGQCNMFTSGNFALRIGLVDLIRTSINGGE